MKKITWSGGLINDVFLKERKNSHKVGGGGLYLERSFLLVHYGNAQKILNWNIDSSVLKLILIIKK